MKRALALLALAGCSMAPVSAVASPASTTSSTAPGPTPTGDFVPPSVLSASIPNEPCLLVGARSETSAGRALICVSSQDGGWPRWHLL